MCGIIGAISTDNIATVLLEGLKRLEYRGYDSAGIVVINSNNEFLRLRSPGKVSELEKLAHAKKIIGNTGLAHTRWATHGKPNEQNAHPHIAANKIALVHNGIIENHEALRKRLLTLGCKLTSDTDSELVAHVVNMAMENGMNFLTAIRAAIKDLQGTYALGFLHAQEPNHLIAVRSGSPLVIGLGDNTNYISSDVLALLPLTQRFIYLEEGAIADIQHNNISIYNSHNELITPEIHQLDTRIFSSEKGEYAHYMLKEIYEQPAAISNSLQERISIEAVLVNSFGAAAEKIFQQTKRVQIIACGTSYHAGLVGKHWLEEIAGIPTQVEVASEYRYRKKIIEANTLFVTLSQSGETADTLAALRQAKKSGYIASLTICNVPESSLVRQSDLIFMMGAGPEIGVASTKAFTCELLALFLFALALGRCNLLTKEREKELIAEVINLPTKMSETLKLNSEIIKVAKIFQDKSNAIFLARGVEYPIALEGALKLKEISYIHAAAYPAGELKHGPLALIDNSIPIVALAPNNFLIEKLKSNLSEVLARNGNLIIFADKNIDFAEKPHCKIIRVPSISEMLAPMLYVIPLQLLAYHVAVLKKTNIDQPRNLAKSVTVE